MGSSRGIREVPIGIHPWKDVLWKKYLGSAFRAFIDEYCIFDDDTGRTSKMRFHFMAPYLPPAEVIFLRLLVDLPFDVLSHCNVVY